MMSVRATLSTLKKTDWQKHKNRIQVLVKEKPLLVGLGLLVVLLFANWIFIVAGKSQTKVIEKIQNSSFQGGRIFGDPGSSFYQGREKQLAQKAAELIERQKILEDKMKVYDEKLAATQTPTVAANDKPQVSPGNSQTAQSSDVRVHDPTTDYEPVSIQRGTRQHRTGRPRLGPGRGSSLIAFPVKDEKPPDGVVLPTGSYVKAKMLTGVDVPEGKTYPVLLALDFSYVAPNETRLDLSGCFMISKAEGDLSTERVQMQASKLSCVSKRGKMFERDVNGFIADNTDGSFAMKGKVNSKQGRVAAMAFMSGVVEGVGKAIQASQTTQTVNPLGGSSSVMTGDADKYALAGGASNAASMVAQWYLKQAQSLSPTVSVDSGRDVWIVMKDKVDLPKEFFRKERSSNAEPSIYSYFSRVAD